MDNCFEMPNAAESVTMEIPAAPAKAQVNHKNQNDWVRKLCLADKEGWPIDD